MNEVSETEEEWAPWNIQLIQNSDYYIESIIDSYNGLEILFSDQLNNKKIKLKFGLLESYRFCDEHARIDVYKKLETNNLHGKYKCFEIKNSEYIKWLDQVSDTLTKIFDLIHYVILDDAGVLDIIAYCEPEVEIIKYSNKEKP